MRIKLALFALALLVSPASTPNASPRQAAPPSATARELTGLLNQFLADVPKNNPASYDRFFADDVIYTRNTGAVTTKADIIKGVSASASRPLRPESTTTFSAEDVTIHEYTDVAIVAFRLVAHVLEPRMVCNLEVADGDHIERARTIACRGLRRVVR